MDAKELLNELIRLLKLETVQLDSLKSAIDWEHLSSEGEEKMYDFLTLYAKTLDFYNKVS